jgi:hypothetical protein
MGADIIEHVIVANTRAEAETKYWACPPYGCYLADEPIMYTSDILKIYDEVFTNETEAITFLHTKAKKWDKTTHMCQCGPHQFAYVVVFAC